MRLNGKFVGDLDEQNLLQLVADGREEDQNLDVKVQVYGGGSGGAELAKDVIGLANAFGGVLLIGVDEKDERIVGVPGLELENGDRTLMDSYDRMLRDRIEPPIQGVQFKAIEIEGGRHVIAIGVPMSISRPHRTKVGGDGSPRSRWTIRRNKNTVDMTYSEIRSAFLESADIERRVRDFHSLRIAHVRQFAERFQGNLGIMLVHVIPLVSEGVRLDIRKALNRNDCFGQPGQIGLAGLRPDLDGVVSHNNLSGQQRLGWAKLYRDGRAEGVTGGYVSSEAFEGGRRVTFLHQAFVSEAKSAVRAYIEGLTRLGFYPPFVIALSLLNAQASNLFRGGQYVPVPLVGPIATFDPVIIDKLDQSETPEYYWKIKPLFDQLWNAFGLPECDLFDKNGRSIG
jgi:hypothetical protein